MEIEVRIAALVRDIRKTNGEITSAIALHLFAPTIEALQECKAMIDYPLEIIMPCGEIFAANSPLDIGDEDYPCPCGDPRHVFLKVTINDPPPS